MSQFIEENEHVFKERRRMILDYEVIHIILMFYDDLIMGHQSKDSTYVLIKERYIWKNMYKNIA